MKEMIRYEVFHLGGEHHAGPFTDPGAAGGAAQGVANATGKPVVLVITKVSRYGSITETRAEGPEYG